MKLVQINLGYNNLMPNTNITEICDAYVTNKEIMRNNKT